MSTRRKNAGTARSARGQTTLSKKANGTGTPQEKEPIKIGVSQIAPALLDFYTALSLVFGGCCSNVLAYEQLLLMNPRIGSALTFSQMLFITAQSLPSFLGFSKTSYFPRLKPRQVPLSQWGLQVLVLTAGSLLNNWAFAYNVPLTILIVFRSAGLPVSMLFGYLISKKRYSSIQISSVVIVTAGVVLATLSRTSAGNGAKLNKQQTAEDLTKYFTGIAMLIVSLFCTGLLGLLQEQTYGKYGPCWREGVFYTHSLSLPVFWFLRNDIKQGITSLSHAGSTWSIVTSFAILSGNLITQLMCVSGVNRLSSQVSSVSTNIALTARKALSLCFSVWWFGNEWNTQLGSGAFMVFFGSLLYTFNAKKINKKE
ncbi:UAA transporter [Crassisporium funariophilum]|nr:UAA transporter [Crassisporium funariophilum]